MLMSFWILLAGTVLLAVMLTSTLVARLPLSGAMIYLVIGFVLGPAFADVVAPDPIRYAGMLELFAQAALLVSLFAVGLKLEVPLLDKRWLAPVRLAFVSMALTVAMLAAIGMAGLDLPLGAAIVLGAILAPTDPVLASAIQPERGDAPDPVRFNLAGEGALNDGTAFPFVLLGLGLMGGHDLGGGWRWAAIDLAWSTLGGLLIGAAVGTGIGTLVLFLRNRHREALGLNEFLSLGIIAVSFGLAQLCLASGFLAAFAAGLALRRVPSRPGASYPSNWTRGGAKPLQQTSSEMKHDVQGFNEQLEKLAEAVLVIVTGAMLAYVTSVPGLWWFTIVALVVVRPVAVFLGLAGSAMPLRRRALIGWFGIRGIGSIFYLAYALNHGLPQPFAQQFVALTLAAVTASILLHGVSVSALMAWYGKGEAGRDD